MSTLYLKEFNDLESLSLNIELLYEGTAET